MIGHEVFFILDPQFRGDLPLLSRAAHVWIVDSVDNSRAVRAASARGDEGSGPCQGVTTFSPTDDATSMFYGMLGTIDLHHGECSAVPPWQAIHVLGLGIGGISETRVAEELGGVPVRLVPEHNGFVIVRAAGQ